MNIVGTSDKKRLALLHIPSAASGDNDKEQATTGVIRGKSDGDQQGDGDDEEQGRPIIGTAPATNTAGQESATSQALSVEDTDPSHFLIRATQGHSIKSVDAASCLERLSSSSSLPDTVVHGTYLSTWPLILAYGGLRCMGRNHVHFATAPSLTSVLSRLKHGSLSRDVDEPVISGMRQNAQVLIYVDLRKALEARCPFWRSENGVILSEGIPKKRVKGEQVDQDKEDAIVPLDFFQTVVERRRGLGVLWEHGKEVQTLPAELTSRGKGNGKTSEKE